MPIFQTLKGTLQTPHTMQIPSNVFSEGGGWTSQKVYGHMSWSIEFWIATFAIPRGKSCHVHIPLIAIFYLGNQTRSCAISGSKFVQNSKKGRSWSVVRLWDLARWFLLGEFDYRYEWFVFVPCPAKDMSGLVVWQRSMLVRRRFGKCFLISNMALLGIYCMSNFERTLIGALGSIRFHLHVSFHQDPILFKLLWLYMFWARWILFTNSVEYGESFSQPKCNIGSGHALCAILLSYPAPVQGIYPKTPPPLFFTLPLPYFFAFSPFLTPVQGIHPKALAQSMTLRQAPPL